MRARATFERRVWRYTREDSDTKLPGRCRMIERGVGADYFETRLDDFETFLGVVAGSSFCGCGAEPCPCSTRSGSRASGEISSIARLPSHAALAARVSDHSAPT
jgi:hypothetical protein